MAAIITVASNGLKRQKADAYASAFLLRKNGSSGPPPLFGTAEKLF